LELVDFIFMFAAGLKRACVKAGIAAAVLMNSLLECTPHIWLSSS
jgi:hypothetical protein